MLRNITPVSKELRKHIRSFSIGEKVSRYPLNYTAYPQDGACIGIFNNTKVTFGENRIDFFKNNKCQPMAIVLGKITKPTVVQFNDYVDEISINFSPSGINFFFETPYAKLAPLPHQQLDLSNWNTFLNDLFNENEKNRIMLLENFLLSQLKHKLKEPLISIEEKIIADPEIKISELSRGALMSQRNFSRYFKEHFGCSPSTFRKILRFRNAINGENSISNDTKKRILSSNFYYDYAHFKRDFGDLTDLDPNDFFAEASLVGDKKHLFKINNG